MTDQLFNLWQNFWFFLKEEEEQEEITPELVARLVTRPEDLPQNVDSSIKKYRDMMLRTLEVLPTDISCPDSAGAKYNSCNLYCS